MFRSVGMITLYNFLRAYLDLHYFYMHRGRNFFLSSTEVFYHAVLYCWNRGWLSESLKGWWVES